MTIKREIKFYKGAIMVALPVMIQQLIVAFGQMVDNLMVGQLNAEAIAAVGIVSNAIFIVIMSIGLGVAEGISIFISQQFGGKLFNKLHHTVCVGVWLSVIATVLIFLILTIFGEGILRMYNLSGESLELGLSYLNIVKIAFAFSVITSTIGAVFRSTSRTKIPMYAGVLAIIVNIILNYALIRGNFGFPAMGVDGAAIATLIARIVEIIALVGIMFYLKPEFLPKAKDFVTVPFKVAVDITKKSIPLIINETLWAAGRSALFIFYGTRGVQSLAALNIANTTANMFFVTMAGFAVTTSIIIGQQLGKNKLHSSIRDSKRLLRLGLIVGLLITTASFILADILPQFYNVDESTRILASDILKITGVFFPIYLLTSCMFFFMRAGADTLGVLIMDSGAMWAITVPISAIAAYYTDFGLVALFFVTQLSEVPKTVIGWWRYKKYNWVVNLNKGNR